MLGRINAAVPGRRPRVIARTARNHTLVWAAIAEKTPILARLRGFARRHRRCHLPTRGRTDLATRFPKATVASKTTSVEMDMRRLTTFARYLVRSALVVCVMSLAAPCAAQEVDPPTVPDLTCCRRWTGLAIRALGLGRTGYPAAETDRSQTLRVLHRRITIPVAQVDLPIRMAKFLTVTPSYMGYSVPASGLNEAPPQPGSIHRQLQGAPISSRRDRGVRRSQVRDLRRNMYVRRFRPAPADDMNRYRGRIGIAHPLRFKAASGNLLPHSKPFMSPRAGGTESAFGLA